MEKTDPNEVELLKTKLENALDECSKEILDSGVPVDDAIRDYEERTGSVLPEELKDLIRLSCVLEENTRKVEKDTRKIILQYDPRFTTIH